MLALAPVYAAFAETVFDVLPVVPKCARFMRFMSRSLSRIVPFGETAREISLDEMKRVPGIFSSRKKKKEKKKKEIRIMTVGLNSTL